MSDKARVSSTPLLARIYYKYEGVSPAGSHKPNTSVPQAYYNMVCFIVTVSRFFVVWNANILLASWKTILHSLFIYFEQWWGHLKAQGNLLPCGSQMKLPINNTLLPIQQINIGILLISWHYFYNYMAFFNWHLRGFPPSPEHPINFALDFHPLPFSRLKFLKFPHQLNMSISPIRIARR